MGDRAALNIRIPEGLPADLHIKIVDALGDEFGIDVFELSPDEPPQTDFTAGEVNLGAIGDVQSVLAALVEETGTDFAYVAWQDPKYEWNGWMIRHTPGLEDFVTKCTAEAEVIIDAAGLTKFIGETDDIDEIRAYVHHVTGAEHEGRLVYPQPEATE